VFIGFSCHIKGNRVEGGIMRVGRRD